MGRAPYGNGLLLESLPRCSNESFIVKVPTCLIGTFLREEDYLVGCDGFKLFRKAKTCKSYGQQWMALNHRTSYSCPSTNTDWRIVKLQFDHPRTAPGKTTRATDQAIGCLRVTKPLETSWVAANGVYTPRVRDDALPVKGLRSAVCVGVSRSFLHSRPFHLGLSAHDWRNGS